MKMPFIDLLRLENEEEYSIPLDISDIISICKAYSKLGGSIQNQIETILDYGLNEAIELGRVKKESIPHIQEFLEQIINNPYFGDAASQAKDCLKLINQIPCIKDRCSKEYN